MKKVFKITLLVTALALAMTVSAAAKYENFAAVRTANGTVINSANAVKYDVIATNSTASDTQCVVLVLKGLWQQADFATAGTVPLTADSILYIDQKPVAASGTATFNVYPKSLPDSTVILTGLSEKPQVVGYTEGKGVTVSGKVKFFGAKTTAKVTLTPVGGGDAISITTPTGAYALRSVLAGTYTLKIDKIGHVTYTKSVVINDTDTNLDTLNMYGGRIKTPSTASVQFEDLAALLGEYEKKLSILTADINEDALVNFTDLSAVLSSYEKVYIA